MYTIHVDLYLSEDLERSAMVIRSASRRVAPSTVTSSGDVGVSSLCQLAGMQECTKGIRELNKETARYCTLLISVGTTQDCAMVRKELKELHRRTVILANQTKDHMLPHLRGRNRNKPELEKFEKMWNDYSCCIELIVSQLWKTFNLVSRFPIKSSTFGQGLMRTGLTEKIVFQRRWAIVMAGLSAVVEPSLIGVDSPLTLSSATAGHDNDETRLIKKAIAETSELLKSIHDVVDIKPWTIKSTVDPELLFDIDNTSISCGSEDAVDRSPSHTRVAVVSGGGGGLCCTGWGGEARGGGGEARGGTRVGGTLEDDKRRRRRLLLVIVIFIVCLVALSTVIAICVRRFL